MSLTVKALRQRVEAAVSAVVGFTLSPLVLDNFARSPESVMHRGFAVGVPESRWTTNGRQRVTVGSLDETTITVRFAYKLKPKAQNASYDAALDDERSLIKAVVGMSRVNVTGLVYDNTRRAVLDSGEWVVLDVAFSAQHLSPLE